MVSGPDSGATRKRISKPSPSTSNTMAATRSRRGEVRTEGDHLTAAESGVNFSRGFIGIDRATFSQRSALEKMRSSWANSPGVSRIRSLPRFEQAQIVRSSLRPGSGRLRRRYVQSGDPWSQSSRFRKTIASNKVFLQPIAQGCEALSPSGFDGLDRDAELFGDLRVFEFFETGQAEDQPALFRQFSMALQICSCNSF